MLITREMSISDFEFFGGAEDTAGKLTENDFDIIESGLLESYPDGIGYYTLNDLFCHYPDEVATYLGYDSMEQLERLRNISFYLGEYDVTFCDLYWYDEDNEIFDEDDLRKCDNDSDYIFVLCKDGVALSEFKNLEKLSNYLDKL